MKGCAQKSTMLVKKIAGNRHIFPPSFSIIKTDGTEMGDRTWFVIGFIC
ncbi:hypothetical protein B4113_3233 [Geobacillus sp. B4113_201601]|nr:hypothetical protein B4113_3233 [Geobacillus sp. B4113_201601]